MMCVIKQGKARLTLKLIQQDDYKWHHSLGSVVNILQKNVPTGSRNRHYMYLVAENEHNIMLLMRLKQDKFLPLSIA